MDVLELSVTNTNTCENSSQRHLGIPLRVRPKKKKRHAYVYKRTMLVSVRRHLESGQQISGDGWKDLHHVTVLAYAFEPVGYPEILHLKNH